MIIKRCDKCKRDVERLLNIKIERDYSIDDYINFEVCIECQEKINQFMREAVNVK